MTFPPYPPGVSWPPPPPPPPPKRSSALIWVAGGVAALIVVSVAVLVAVLVGQHAATRLRDEHHTSAAPQPAPTPAGRQIVYEVFGPAGTVADINYLDADVRARRVTAMRLPWSVAITSTEKSFNGNVVAQGDTDSISCRILVDGVVKDERTAQAANAQTFCLVQAA